MTEKRQLVPLQHIERRILTIRGQKVMFDEDLASLYGVTVKRFNEQVKRNKNRFPQDFMFQLTKNEWDSLRSQNATLKGGRGSHRKYAPFVFTEHGAVMLANVLRSHVAVQASVQVVRAFVRLRELSLSHHELESKINRMERKYDRQFKAVFDAIRELMKPPASKGRQIGFVTNGKTRSKDTHHN